MDRLKNGGPTGRPADKDLMERIGSFRTAEVYVSGEGKLHTIPVTGGGRPAVPGEIRARWQRSLDVLVAALRVSAGYVMCVEDNGLTACLRAGDPEVGFPAGTRIPFGIGSPCENTLGLDRLHVVDNGSDPSSGGAAKNMRGYCGLPIHWPDGSFFGALCLMDRSSPMPVDGGQPLVRECCLSLEKDLENLCLRQNRDSRSDQYARVMEALLQYAPGGIFSYSAEKDEEFSFLSDNMLAFLGYTKEEFIRKFDNRFSRMVWAEDRERTLREIDEQIQRGPFDRCEYRIEKKDGTLAWVHDEGHIVADEKGKKWFYVVIVDITETVRAQLRERDKFRASMQSMLAANPEAISVLQLNLTRNLRGDGHALSRTTRDIIGVDSADAFFAGVAARILSPAVREAFVAVFRRDKLLEAFAAGHASRSIDYTRLGDRGETVWVRLYLNLLRNPDTEDVEGVAYSVDVSGEKRREEILDIITNQEYDLIALVHLDAGTVEAYHLGPTLPAAVRAQLPREGAVCGLGEYRDRASADWLHPEDREKYRRFSDPAYYRPVMDRTGHYEFVLRQRFPDVPGGEMYRKYQHYYLGNDRDTILVIESDVTEASLRQVRELDKARAETQRVKDIMDSITCGIAVLHMTDPDHLAIDYVNLQLFRILDLDPVADAARSSDPLVAGYMADAFVGVHPEDAPRVRKTFRDHFGSDYFIVDDYRTVGRDGVYHWIKEEVRLKAVTPEYRVFYATYHDVGEEVRLHTELTRQLESEKQLRLEADAANAAKSDFLSRMSHDIRTPLNGIIGMTYLAREQDNPPRTADCLKKIDLSSKFLLGLINDVLDMSRAESNRIALNPEPYPLSEFEDYLDAVVRPLCKEKGQRFVVDQSGAITDLVPLADKLRVNQILFNLLSNAVKYTPEGGTITYRISNRRTAGDRLTIDHEITDTGIGMSESFQKVLFDPFTQEGRDDNSETRGTGLGLAIVKKLVDLMGGTISVRSRQGQGTTFRLRLEFPAVPAAGASGAPSAAAADSAADALRGRHVLLCEDHPLNQEIARALLERRGATVVIASNGKRGVDLFALSPLNYYDAILMDVRMPVMDGLTATRQIRALHRPDAAAVPILAMTADAFADDVKRCLAAGMNGHLSKPIDPAGMESAIAEAIARRGGA